MALVTGKHLSRRTFLRGAGVSVALPFLDAMVPAGRARAAGMETAGDSSFTRLVCIEESMGVAGSSDWGDSEHLFAPAGEGRDFELGVNSQLKPLEAFRDYMTIVSNTDCRSAEAFRAEEIGGDHDRTTAVFLTQSHPKQTQGSDILLGTSIDQIHAQRFGRETALPSLELCIEGIDRGGGCAYNYHCAYTTSLAWASPNQPLPAIREPRVVFERLFGAGDTPEERAARRRTSRSMIDWIATEVARLKRSLGAADRVALDEYTDHIWEIERRIALVEARNASGEEREMPEAPSGVPDSFEEHMQLMFDLQVLALQTDLTRVITFKTGFDQSNRVFPESGTTKSIHAASHHGNVPADIMDFHKINTYRMAQLDHFLTKMRDTVDGDGSLLDKTAIVWGSAMADGNLHNHRKVPLLDPRSRKRSPEGGAPSQSFGGNTHGKRLREPDAEDRAREHDRIRRQHGRLRAGAYGMIVRASALFFWIATTTALAGAAPLPDLVDAARRGDAQAARSLLDRGADVNAAEGDGMTALHWASERGDAEIVQILFAASADVAARTRIGSYSPLHLASRGGHAPVVRLLLEAGGDPHAVTTTSGVTPLHLAAAAIGGGDAVATLLDHGADPNARESSAGQTPLMFAASANRAASVKELLKHGADPRAGTRIVDVLESLARDREATKRLRAMLSHSGEVAFSNPETDDADADADAGTHPYGRVEPLEVERSPSEVQAAIRGQREFRRSGYDVGNADAHSLASVRPDYPGGPDVVRPPFTEVLVGKTGGMTALLHAAREGHIESASALLDGDADVNQVSADGTSPLLIAALNGQFDLALVLLARGADPNLAASTDGGSPLFAVLQTQWAPKSNYPQPRAQDEQKAQYMDVMKALLDAGADPNVRLRTHLWYWEYGLNKMGIDLTGATPFWRAAFAQDIGAMKLLAAHGANPNVPTRWPEVGMRERRQQDGRQQEDSALPYIPEGAPNAHPIHAAAGGGYIGLGAFSVRNVPDQFLPAVKYLVEEHGADVNLSDSWGYRPLHYAASRGDNALIRYLVFKGADVTKITRLGQSTADMARGGRGGFFTRVAYPETVELLTSMGSSLECLHTHFLDTGDFCEGAGVNDPWAPNARPPSEADTKKR